MIYYPGYVAESNGQKLPIVRGDGNMMRIILPEGNTEGDVRIYYRESALFILGDIITLGMIAYLIIRFRVWPQKKKPVVTKKVKRSSKAV